MTLDKMKQLYIQRCVENWNLLTKKGHDYATDDRLSNFKRMATYLDQSACEITLFYLFLKLDRLSNIIQEQKKIIYNEPIQDTIQDLRNYLFLLDCLISENTTEQNALGATDTFDQTIEREIDKALEDK